MTTGGGSSVGSGPSAPKGTVEETLFDVYDRQRRLRLLQVIAPLLASLVGIFLLGYAIFFLRLILTHTMQSSFILVFINTSLIGVAYLVSFIATRRARVGLASWSITGATTFAFVEVTLVQGHLQGMGTFVISQFAGFIVTTLLAGILGNRAQMWVIATIGVLDTIATVLISPLPTGSTGLTAQQNGIAIAFLLVAEMGTAVIVLAVQHTSRATLAEMQSLQTAYNYSKQLDDLKNQFISSVNHEIRNPVMAMMGYLENIAAAPATVPRERLTIYAQRAMNAAASLRRLIDSILDTRRMDQGAHDFTPEPVALRLTFEAAIELIDPQEGKLTERDLLLHMSDQLVVMGEPVRLQQVFTNLLSNAVKYSPSGTAVEVTARPVTTQLPAQRRKSPDRRDWVEIRIRDHGLGVPPDQAPLLFNRFVRLPRDLASNVVGNGMGLYLCKVLIEAMGGRIWVESSGIPGEGSTFVVQLTTAETLPTTPSTPSDVSDRRIPFATRA